MKRACARLLALLAALALTACGGSGDDKGNLIRIGVYEPSSGASAAGGKKEILGVEYAHSVRPTVTIGGEVYAVELVAVDNQSENDKGVSAAQQLVNEGVSIILGSYSSGLSMAAAPVFEEAGIPAIAPSCTNPGVTLGNPYYFRICYLDPFQGSVLANLAAEEFDAGVAYVLTELGDDYSVGLGYYFAREFERLGGAVVADQNTAGNADMSGFITAAKSAGADIIFAPCSTAAASLLISQGAFAGIPMLGGDTWDDAVILQAAAKSGAEVYFSTFYDEAASPSAAAFLEGFQAWLNANGGKLTSNGGTDTVSAVSALGYDAYMVALEAVEAAGSADSEAVAQALWDIRYTGVTGEIAFDGEGDAEKDAIFIKRFDPESGTIQSVKEQSLGD